MDIPKLHWIKSSFSSGNGACCEAAHHRTGTAFRDSKNPAGGTLHFARGEWRTFLSAVKHGR
ncbi:DUF397 domain-containing protein [Actinokineospora auranticolor]|uniref:Uncharacterized protein DUF397 n=1 Tax=Actinokineospora auranticolor TaxID=155976 RepID=A0A2S6GN02_9PSEU|nr:DUF397 domain-containing protein [Actinokineospora auranticolor]PPK66546.1 uncharacterized protein DUF397 [Actinokineospora auranticolor]